MINCVFCLVIDTGKLIDAAPGHGVKLPANTLIAKDTPQWVVRAAGHPFDQTFNMQAAHLYQCTGQPVGIRAFICHLEIHRAVLEWAEDVTILDVVSSRTVTAHVGETRSSQTPIE